MEGVRKEPKEWLYLLPVFFEVACDLKTLCPVSRISMMHLLMQRNSFLEDHFEDTVHLFPVFYGQSYAIRKQFPEIGASLARGVSVSGTVPIGGTLIPFASTGRANLIRAFLDAGAK